MENEVKPVFDFLLFKTQFVLALYIAAKEYQMCKSFIKDISESKDIEGFVKVFKKRNEEIAEWLGVDLEPVEQVCTECSQMEDEVEELRDKFLKYKFITDYVPDEYKFRSFVQAKDKYSLSELEYLLENGKQLLNKSKITA